jgi:hypothetical protein
MGHLRRIHRAGVVSGPPPIATYRRAAIRAAVRSPATVAGYLAHLADSGRKASTIARRLAAIAYAHKLKGLEPPTSTEALNAVMRGIRRTIGGAFLVWRGDGAASR